MPLKPVCIVAKEEKTKENQVFSAGKKANVANGRVENQAYFTSDKES